MRLTIFGATGPTGQILLRKALAAGHEVTVHVRKPGKLGALASRVTVVAGELTDAPAIGKALAGSDAVISLLGPGGRSKGTPIADGTRKIVAAMEDLGIRRLISTATPSATDANDRFRLSFWLAVAMVKALAGTAYKDIVETAAVIRASSLDWTIARLPMLSNDVPSGPAAAGYVGDAPIKLFSLSRDALADFLLAQVTDGSWSRKAPALSNG